MAGTNSRLVQAQHDFAQALAHLIVWANEQGMTVTIGEVERPKAVAELYARDGRGVRDSQHINRLAADLRLYVDGVYQTETSAYARLGARWKQSDIRARWGGDFSRPDGNHFEFHI